MKYFMNFNSLKFVLILVLICLFSRNLIALPVPLPPNINIKDILKHGTRAIDKNKEDKNSRQEYNNNQEEFNKNITDKEDKDLIRQKNFLREKFNGTWSGEFVIKKEKQINISCKIKISIKSFEGKVSSYCNEIQYSIYLFINLDRNLEKSFIQTSLNSQKIDLFGDLSSFGGNNFGLYVKGSLDKL